MPYLEKERKTRSDGFVMSVVLLLYLVSSIWVTFKKVMLHKYVANSEFEARQVLPGEIFSMCQSRRKMERQDEANSHKKTLEITLLVCKMFLFMIANSIVHRFNQSTPEELMEYPGIVYCLIVQFGIGPTLIGTIVGFRYWKSASLRDYAGRKMQLLISRIGCSDTVISDFQE